MFWPYRFPHDQNTEIEKFVQEMVDSDIIRVDGKIVLRTTLFLAGLVFGKN